MGQFIGPGFTSSGCKGAQKTAKTSTILRRMQTTSALQANSATSADQDFSPANLLRPSDTFVHRHVGPNAAEIKEMLAAIGCDSLDDLVEQTVPAAIRIKRPLKLGEPRGEIVEGDRERQQEDARPMVIPIEQQRGGK